MRRGSDVWDCTIGGRWRRDEWWNVTGECGCRTSWASDRVSGGVCSTIADGGMRSVRIGRGWIACGSLRSREKGVGRRRLFVHHEESWALEATANHESGASEAGSGGVIDGQPLTEVVARGRALRVVVVLAVILRGSAAALSTCMLGAGRFTRRIVGLLVAGSSNEVLEPARFGRGGGSDSTV